MEDVIIGPLVEKLQELAIDEAQALGSVGEDIRNLRDMLMWMQAFLRDADPRRRIQADEFTRVWIKQTRDAAFEAEDAVDQYDLRVDLSRYGSRTRAVLGFLASFTTQVRLRHELSTKIKSINSRLDNISENKSKFGTTEQQALIWRASTTISAAANTELCHSVPLRPLNRAKEVNELYEMLVSRPSDSLVVVHVTGQSGVGKTTLVEEVYQKLRVNNHFILMPWSTITPGMSVARIRQQIYQELSPARELKEEKLKEEQLKEEKTPDSNNNKTSEKIPDSKDDKTSEKTPGSKENKTIEPASDKAPEKTKDKAGKDLDDKLKEKYLLVVDGEISTSRWNHLLDSLPDIKGSKVLRITRGSAQVLPHQTCLEHKVQPLKKKETIELFFQRVCKAEGNDEYNAAVGKFVRMKYRKLIFRVTQGLPLAIVLLAGLVKTKEFPGEWKAVFEHLDSKQLKRLDTILSLCYDDLPYDIKSCFLYFAALPADMSVGARELICMWMAEGFLRPQDGMTMEKVGNRYMQELIDRYLVRLDDGFSPGDEEVVIHSKVSAFLQLEAQESSFMDIHTSDDAPNFASSRRLSLRNYSARYTALASPMPKLRSILGSFEEDDTHTESESSSQQCLPAFPCCQQPCRPPGKEESLRKHIKQLLRKSKFLRVINLDGLEIGEKLPHEIGNMLHLQYLGVTSAWPLQKIPASIGRLRNLQTLDVRFTLVEKLPKELWKISTLRHVLGDGLILPRKVGKLQHLQTLESIIPDKKKGWDKRTFENMICLQTLEIWDLPTQKTPPAVVQSDQKNHGKASEEISAPAVVQSDQIDEAASAEISPAPVQSDYQNDETAPAGHSPTVVQSKQNNVLSSAEKSPAVPPKSKDKIEDALSGVLRKLEQLRKLTLRCEFTIPLELLSMVSSPLLPNLAVVELYGKVNSPQEMGRTKLCLPNLLTLSLQNTEVQEDLFEKLAAGLSFLENLSLGSDACQGDCLVFPPGAFQSLKKLSISLLSLKNVEIGKSALTRLEDLQISYYPESNAGAKVEIHGKDNIVNKIKRENEDLCKQITHIPDSTGQSSEKGH